MCRAKNLSQRCAGLVLPRPLFLPTPFFPFPFALHLALPLPLLTPFSHALSDNSLTRGDIDHTIHVVELQIDVFALNGHYLHLLLCRILPAEKQLVVLRRLAMPNA